MLIVDDNEFNCYTFKALVDTYGFSAKLASNGQEALDKVKE